MAGTSCYGFEHVISLLGAVAAMQPLKHMIESFRKSVLILRNELGSRLGLKIVVVSGSVVDPVHRVPVRK